VEYKHFVNLHVINGVRNSAHTQARLPEPSEWHSVHTKSGVVINHDCRRIHTLEDSDGGVDVFSEHSSVEGERQVVSDFDGDIDALIGL
jgi:hypothetical protein